MARKTGSKPRASTEIADRHVEDVDISGVMRSSYRDYAAAVVVGRAIADVRDGLKPVHRRILYAMKVGGYDWSAGYRKSARIVGDVIGKYHPHGDSSVYDAMARLTQTWSVTAPLVDGQGNFGSPDGDNPAAMRYTEARLARISRYLLEEINRDTVDFTPNYDETEEEPAVLPAAFPNVLVNGGSGIAVGMASSVPPHNLAEVIDATLLLLKAPNTGLDALMSILPGPDFPTGGRVIGSAGIRKAYEFGRGSLDIEATTHFERDGKAPLIVYTDMPWGITRPAILARINQMIGEGTVPDILSARDETDRTGPRFVVELRAGADPEHVDRILKTQTGLRTGISLNFTLLDAQGLPREMGLRDLLSEWIGFRRQTVRRRSIHDLKKAQDRARLLFGRIVALSVIDRIVKLIRAAQDRTAAIEAICAQSFARSEFEELVGLLGTHEQKRGKRFSLSITQAEDILAMRLQRLTGLERAGLESEVRQLVAQINGLREILAEPARLDGVIATELAEIRALAPGGRRTIIDAAASIDVARAEKLAIPCETTWVLETPEGRFARAKKGLPEGMIARAREADTHSRLVFFTTAGTAYGMDVFDLPALEAREAPRPVPGLIGQTPDGAIASAIVLGTDDLKSAAEGGAVLCFVSEDASVRRTEAAEFARIPASGKVAMKLESSDPPLLSVFREEQDGGAVLLGSAAGRFIRFALGEVRVFAGRTARGVRGMKLDAGDRVVSALEVPDQVLDSDLADRIEKAWLGKIAKKDQGSAIQTALEGAQILQLAETGHMKRTPLACYRQTRRDNRGINDRGPAKTIGPVSGFHLVRPGQIRVALVTEEGASEIEIQGIRRTGKAATGGIDAPAGARFFR